MQNGPTNRAWLMQPANCQLSLGLSIEIQEENLFSPTINWDGIARELLTEKHVKYAPLPLRHAISYSFSLNAHTLHLLLFTHYKNCQLANQINTADFF